jgi:hypothetical protein
MTRLYGRTGKIGSSSTCGSIKGAGVAVSYDQVNRLVSSTLYDAPSTTRRETSPTGTAPRQYDAFNQMTRMPPGSENWTYAYTADDEGIWIGWAFDSR